MQNHELSDAVLDYSFLQMICHTLYKKKVYPPGVLRDDVALSNILLWRIYRMFHKQITSLHCGLVDALVICCFGKMPCRIYHKQMVCCQNVSFHGPWGFFSRQKIYHKFHKEMVFHQYGLFDDILGDFVERMIFRRCHKPKLLRRCEAFDVLWVFVRLEKISHKCHIRRVFLQYDQFGDVLNSAFVRMIFRISRKQMAALQCEF